MATILTSQYGVREDTIFIVFDIEAFGDVNTPEKCRMWNIAACVLGQATDNIDLYIQPAIDNIPKEGENDFCNIAEGELEALGASSLQDTMQKFMSWVNKKKENPDSMIIFCSHGCFRYDKILLEHEFMRNGLHFQPNIYFLDTLHWTRQAIRGRGSYALCDIYKDIFRQPFENQHRAYGDTLALNNVMCSLTNTGHMLSGVMYPPFFTPIVRIPGIGICSERILVNKHVHCVEELYVMYSQIFRCSSDAFIGHLCGLGLPPDSSRCVLMYLIKNFNA
tara:strand:+ start:44 stop:877 length:834 start_codon:yes stop_codon:yes gene_type:complete